MKTKHSLIIIGIGFCLDFVGAFMKILHHPHSNSLLVAGTALKVVGVILLIYKLATYPKIKDLMNW